MATTNMKVITRLRIGFGVVLSLMVLIIAYVYFQFTGIAAVNTRIADSEWVKAEAISTINALTRSNGRNTLELLIAKDKAQEDRISARIEENRKTITENFETLDKLVYLPKGKELLGKAKEARGKFVASFTQVRKLLSEGKKDEAIELANSETLPLLDALREPIDALTVVQKQIVTASIGEIKSNIAFSISAISIAGGLALGLGFFIAALISRKITRQLGGEPYEAVHIAGEIAKGDLAITINTRGSDQTSLLFALKEMRDGLVKLVGEVRSGTDSIATASSQIASGNQDLAARTESQAGSLEETASSMEELTSTVKHNADNAKQANRLAESASQVAIKGGAVVAQVVQTMGAINTSSKKIVDIIAVIDGIAFQTNILALNAAVEAARAGEQGRGFAVVASEVRSLAQRSSSAAKEIKSLIDSSVAAVDTGAQQVAEAGATMQEIVNSIDEVTTIMQQIMLASNEQAQGIEQVNTAINQMDQFTQQNAALVEESAAAAEGLSDQAKQLVELVSVFKIVPNQNFRLLN